MANNKKDLAQEISVEYDINFEVSQKIVKKIFSQIINKIAKEGRIELRNFGVFKSVRKESRKARNPKNGTIHLVPTRYYVKFKPGKEMVEKITETYITKQK